MNLRTLQLPPELQAYIIVGGTVAAIHFLIVLCLVQWQHWHPLLANIVAFLVAFQFSYLGHRFWTFADTTLTHKQSFIRFFLIASSSFALNEILYYFLLAYTPLPYWLSLGIVLVLVAVITFINSRLWAFSKHHS